MIRVIYSELDGPEGLLLHLGLNPTQIATIMQVAPRTTTVYRYRLRQKLNLPPNASLEEKLKELSSDPTPHTDIPTQT